MRNAFATQSQRNRQDDEELLPGEGSNGNRNGGHTWRSKVSPTRGAKVERTMLTLVVFCVIAVLVLSMIPRRYVAKGYRPSVAEWDPTMMSGDNSFPTLPTEVQDTISKPGLSEDDRRDRTMDDARCRKEFPLLYPQLDEIMRYWQTREGITKELIDELERDAHGYWGHVRLIIHRGKVYIRKFREGSETRVSAMVHLIQQAIDSWPGGAMAKADTLPTVELILSPGDRDSFPKAGGWLVTRAIRDENAAGTWLLPDFGFIGWPEANIPSWEEFLDQADQVEAEYPWYRKHSKAFWRGLPNVYAIRQDMMSRADVAGHPERTAWSDVRATTFWPDGQDHWAPLVTIPEHCQHKYLIHVEGNSYSGRGRYTLSCHAVTVTHPLEWTQHFHAALNPLTNSTHQNYVQLPGPLFTGLEEVVRELRQSDGRLEPSEAKAAKISGNEPKPPKYLGINGAQRIADNARRTLRQRYLTPAATMCYTRAALRHYAEALNRKSWGPDGPRVLPGHGILPGSSKNRLPDHPRGDIEVGIWRLLGAPNWPLGQQ